VLLANRKWEGNDLAASATSMREHWSWLPPGTTGIRVLVGSPDLANREQVRVAVSSVVLTV